MTHTIVAYRIKGTKEGLSIAALTQSPRGTKVFLKEVKIPSAGLERNVRASNLLQAFETLNPDLVQPV